MDRLSAAIYCVTTKLNSVHLGVNWSVIMYYVCTNSDVHLVYLPFAKGDVSVGNDSLSQ